MRTRYDAVILAGGRAPWLKSLAGTDIRSLAKLQDKPLLCYTMDTLRASGRINNIYVASDTDALAQMAAAGITGFRPVVCNNMTLAEVVLTAAEAVEADKTVNHKIFFVCDDVPLLTAEAVNSFLDQCEAKPEGEIYWTVIKKETCEAQFPEGVRTYGPLSDGKFTGGNVSLLTRNAVAKTQDIARQLYDNRKHPFKLCGLLGWWLVVRALFHCLSSSDVEKRCTELMGVECRAIISEHACIGMDMDKPKDWDLVRSKLAGNKIS